MYFIYLDEAGSPSQSDSSNEYVLSALIVHESKKFKIISQVCDLKRKYFSRFDPSEIELHMKHIAHHNGVFKELGLEREKELIKDIGRLIQNIDCTLIAVVIKKRNLSEKKKDQVSEIAMKYLFERISIFLNDFNKFRPDTPQFGILMIDSINAIVNNKIRNQVMDMVRNGTEYNKSDFFIDQPLFVESFDDHIMQLTDYVSYCMRRRMMYEEDKNEANREMYHNIINSLKSKFFRDGK